MTKTEPSIETLNTLLILGPKTGNLFWRKREADQFTNLAGRAEAIAEMWNKKFAGKEAEKHHGFHPNHGRIAA